MKKTLSIFFIALFALGIFLAPLSGVYAEEASNVQNLSKLDNLKTKANKEIDRRAKALGLLAMRVNSIKKLTENQKTAFSEEIKQNLTELTNLKTKISTETDYAVLKEDVKSVIASYKIHAVYMPKIHILSAAGSLTRIASKSTTLSEKLNARITEAEASGKDVANLKTLLVNMKAKIATAEGKIVSAEEKALSAEPSGFPENKSTLVESNKMLVEAKQSLISAKQDATEIVAGLKKLQ